MVSTWTFSLLFVSILLKVEGETTIKESSHYSVGDPVLLECKDWTSGNWTFGPRCKESGQELSLSFGYDNFVYCGLNLADKTSYHHFVALAQLEETWQCRVAMSKLRDFFVPFTIPIWGVVEEDHLHVDNHLNFVFHVDEGKIIAATAYPVRDRFQFVKAGSLISLHGPVRWFHRHAFQSFLGSNPALQDKGRPRTPETNHDFVFVFICSLLSSLATALGAVIFYQRKLKPRIIKRCMKNR
mmetsp:Transcript_6538/g.8874  ORF Transcript_6538/g.8874 Transcript_6538/m.8874 type:complete len:241 (-) Transcript_6538:162-884(-)